MLQQQHITGTNFPLSAKDHLEGLVHFSVTRCSAQAIRSVNVFFFYVTRMRASMNAQLVQGDTDGTGCTWDAMQLRPWDAMQLRP
jgi:hypothetical protein